MSQHQYIQQHQGANGTQSPNRYNQQGVNPSVVISPSAPVSEGHSRKHTALLFSPDTACPSSWRRRNHASRPGPTKGWPKVAAVRQIAGHSQRYSARGCAHPQAPTLVKIRHFRSATARTGKAARLPRGSPQQTPGALYAETRPVQHHI